MRVVVFELSGNRFSLAFVPKGVAFGILAVLLPLYVIEETGGNVLDVGLLFFLKGLVQVPAAVLWAQWIEKKRGCKVFILMSFLISSLVIFLFTIVNSVWVFLALNVLLSIFYVAHVRAGSVLIVESAPSSEWMDGVAQHGLLVGLSGTVGLLLGGLWMTSLDNRSLMLLCGVLVLFSLILSIAWIREPRFMIERRIVRVERFVHLAEEASNLACAPVSYGRVAEERYLTRYPRPKPLILGIFLFPLASSLVFTSIPVFLSIKIGASSSLIFYILLIRSITTLVGYTLIRIHKQRKLLKTIKTASILGILFPILILLSAFLPSHLSLTLSSLALAIAGFAGPKFSTAGTVLWTKCAPKGTAGTYRAGLTFGTALGSLLGGFIPSYYGFNALFTVSAIISAMCLFFFSLTTRKRW